MGFIYKYHSVHLTILTLVLCVSCVTESIDAPPGFEIESGFQLELVASEPIIKDPVDIEFDENGDAYVLEMPGYPFEDSESRIIKLEDKDQDGIYDSGITYAEDLQLASSILPYKGGMLVAAPPYLLFVKDLDGDNKVDQRDTLLDGFSTGNLQHNYNGLSLGLDNILYAANGGNSGSPFWYGDSTAVLDLGWNDIKIDLENKKMERLGHTSGGFELAFDPWGRMYETHNLEHVSQLVFPATYMEGARLPLDNLLSNVSDHEENGLARIFPIGEQQSRVNHPEQSGYFSGACGVTYYGGGALGAEYENTVWVADVVLNLIHVDKIAEDGSKSIAMRVLSNNDFIASTDRSFRPVNMTVGPDGSMYVVDMYRDVIEHPEWIPDEMESKLDLEAGKDKGRIYKVSNKGRQPKLDFQKFSSEEGLLSLLSEKNQWLRNTAHRLLMEQSLSDATVAKLEDLCESNDPAERLHALWILHNKGKLTTAILAKSLNHESNGLQENALQIAESYMTDQNILDQTIALLTDENQRVRMQAALAISTIDKKQFEVNRNSIIEALNNASHLPTDLWNNMAITLASKWDQLDLFESVVSNEKINEELLQFLTISMTQEGKHTVEILDQINSKNLSAESKQNLVQAIAENIETNNTGQQFKKQILALENNASMPLLTSATLLRSKIGLAPSEEFVRMSKASRKAVLDQKLPNEERLNHLNVISLNSSKTNEEILFSLISNKEPIALQEAALAELWKSEDSNTGYQLVEKWPELGPQARRTVSDILLYKEVHHDALLAGLENQQINIGEMNFDLERRRTLLWWTDNEDTKRRAKALFTDAGVVNRKDVIHKMSPALTLAGDGIHGQELFDNLCGQCHLYGNRGQDVGPVLTEINRKSRESLMHDILDPNAAVDTKYINHKLETNDGAIHIGIVDSETDFEISIKKLGGSSVTVTKENVKSLSSLGSSMMPEGLEGNLAPQEMADLLAYLQGT